MFGQIKLYDGCGYNLTTKAVDGFLDAIYDGRFDETVREYGTGVIYEAEVKDGKLYVQVWRGNLLLCEILVAVREDDRWDYLHSKDSVALALEAITYLEWAPRSEFDPEKVKSLVRYIVERLPERMRSPKRIMALIYLVDWLYARYRGRTFTGARWINR